MDANGKFTMNGIVPGQYELFAWQEIVQGAYQNEDDMRRYEAADQVRPRKYADFFGKTVMSYVPN